MTLRRKTLGNLSLSSERPKKEQNKCDNEKITLTLEEQENEKLRYAERKIVPSEENAKHLSSKTLSGVLQSSHIFCSLPVMGKLAR